MRTMSLGSTGMGPAETKAMQSIPYGVDKKQLLNDASKWALKDDWSCIDPPPMLNPGLPGLRYGASIEIRPQLALLPCPCAGGVWTPPSKDAEAVLQPGGLWAGWQAHPRNPEELKTQTSYGKVLDQALAGAGTKAMAALGTAADPKNLAGVGSKIAGSGSGAAGNLMSTATGMIDVNGSKREPSSLFAGMMNQAMGALGMGKYIPGSEPYAADYGCQKGFVKGTMGMKWSPGKRWWDGPQWGTVVVPTTCPCALGPWTGMQVQKQPPEQPPDKVPPLPGDVPLPPWQNKDNTPFMGDMGFGAPAVALATEGICRLLASSRRKEMANDFL